MTLNVLGTELVPCSYAPLTGFFRDGCCNTRADDTGLHLLCAKVTAEFLEFSAQRGNDLTTPQPAYRFAGLKPGDRWCLCVARWREALDVCGASGGARKHPSKHHAPRAARNAASPCSGMRGLDSRPTERWMSGLSRTPGKRVGANNPPRVRIPPSPPRM